MPRDVKPVLTDTRGPFTFVILAGSDATATCVTGPQFVSVSGSGGPGATTVAADKLALMGSHFTTRDGHAFAIVEGHAGSDVSDATLVLSDGSRVKASLSNGWFAA
jgi:hypothetical protein